MMPDDDDFRPFGQPPYGTPPGRREEIPGHRHKPEIEEELKELLAKEGFTANQAEMLRLNRGRFEGKAMDYFIGFLAVIIIVLAVAAVSSVLIALIIASFRWALG